MPSFFKVVMGLWVLLLATGVYAVQRETGDIQREEQGKPAVIKAFALADHGTPKYKPGFAHFDYVNPDAPKGGELRLAMSGSYDNFNGFAHRGDAVIDAFEPYETLVFDSLFTVNRDEEGVIYPLVAESVEYPHDKTWAVFNINPDARHQDGKPITAEDVVFSFYKLYEEGVPFVKQNYKGVSEVSAISEHKVKFEFSENGRELLIKVALIPIFSKGYWADKNLSEPIKEPVMGSGPYAVSSYDMGKSVTYQLQKDYWAKDLPVRKGLYNFEFITWDYYLDGSVMFQAFKAGEYDYRRENVASQWAEGYDVPAVKSGEIQRQEVKHDEPPPIQALIFNTQRDILSDRLVRQALNLMFDFEWYNKNLFYDSYVRTTSYFEGTPYKATGKPEGKELEVLNQFKDQLPEEVFGEIWRPNVTDASGRMRQEMREAIALFKRAGWELKDRKMTRLSDGKPFELTVLTYTPTFERILLPYKRNLEKIGVTLDVRMVDSTQFLNRLRSRDFEMITGGFLPQNYPNRNMRLDWHSDYIDSTHNQTGVQDPVIDALIEGIVENKDKEELLRAYGRAFDRVALWNFYIIPNWYSNKYRLAYWNKFSMPAVRPKFTEGIESWWYDPEKAKTLKQ
ncbi:MAG TPA: extracellular solute-binding protein [Cellvibrionaceae bacterium]